MNKPVKVLIGLPTMGSIDVLLASVILRWTAEAIVNKDKGLSVYPTVAVQPVDNARNEIVKTMLFEDFTHLLFIDSDTIPPLDGLDKLLAHDVPIVSGLTPIIELDERRKNDSNGFYKKWNCVDQNDQHVQPNTGVVPIKGAGSSFILIKREVFEKMPAPWYRFIYKDDSGRDVNVSEDIHFVIKAIGLGYKPIADTSVICNHRKSILW